MSKSKYSILNAVSAMVMTLANGFLGIVVTRYVITYFGSDFNGLNSTANQIVNMLLVLEGGFTLASNVALFAPLSQGDYSTVNSVLAATRAKFRRIGLLFLGIGSLIAIGYAFMVNSSFSFEFVTTLILMTIIPAAFNLFYASTYRVLLQAQQKEFVVSLITAATLALGHISNIVMIKHGGPMWAVRMITMLFALFNSLLIARYVKYKNRFVDCKQPPRPDLIKGTGAVMVQKITGVIYGAAPIVFLSVLPSGGTMLASVYAVYNNIFQMVKTLLHAVIDAPRLSFGQLLTEKKREDVWDTFAQYEYAAFTAVFVMLTTCCALIMPFIGLYTADVTDIDYYDTLIAVTMVLIATVEMIHLPCGHLINMAGRFQVAKNFQITACCVLIVSLSVGGWLFGVYGMLFALLLCALLLATLEMGYVHLIFFEKKLWQLFRLLFPPICVGTALCFVEMNLSIALNGYLSFILYGALFATVNGICAVLVGLLFNRKTFLPLLRRVKNILCRERME